MARLVAEGVPVCALVRDIGTAVRCLQIACAGDSPLLAAGFCAGFAQLAMTRAYSLEIAARVSPFGYISVAVSAGLGAVALHEWPDRLAVLGMLLVVSGGLVVTVAGMREAARIDKVNA